MGFGHIILFTIESKMKCCAWGLYGKTLCKARTNIMLGVYKAIRLCKTRTNTCIMLWVYKAIHYVKQEQKSCLRFIRPSIMLSKNKYHVWFIRQNTGKQEQNAVSFHSCKTTTSALHFSMTFLILVVVYHIYVGILV
mgnify:CR=1 FL=1